MKHLIVLALVPAIFGCASSSEKKVEADIARQESTDTAVATEQGRLSIWTSDQLTKEQKDKLLTIMDATQAEVAAIRAQEAKIKGSFFQTLAQGKFNRKEVATYKSKLQKLENKKMDLMFASLEKVQSILEAEIKQNPRILHELYNDRMAW